MKPVEETQDDDQKWRKREEAYLLEAENLYGRLQERLSGEVELDGRVEDCISRLSILLPYIPRLSIPTLYLKQAELAIDALSAGQPKTELTVHIIEELEKRVRVYKSVLRSIWDSRSPATMVVVGVVAMAVSASVLLGAVAALITWLEGAGGDVSWLKSYTSLIYNAAIPGAFGSIASILVRIRGFARLQIWGPEADPQVLFLVGLFNPFVGMLSALFVYFMVKGQIIGILGNMPVPEAYAALAFVAGFSERLAQDLAQKTHETVAGGQTRALDQDREAGA